MKILRRNCVFFDLFIERIIFWFVQRGIGGQEQNQGNILGSGRGEKLPDELGHLGYWNGREGYRFEVSVETELTKLAYRLNLSEG